MRSPASSGRQATRCYVYDPVALDAALASLEAGTGRAESVADLLERSDVVVIATPWPEFAELPLERAPSAKGNARS